MNWYNTSRLGSRLGSRLSTSIIAKVTMCHLNHFDIPEVCSGLDWGIKGAPKG